MGVEERRGEGTRPRLTQTAEACSHRIEPCYFSPGAGIHLTNY